MKKSRNWPDAGRVLLVLLLLAISVPGITGCGKRSPMQNLSSAGINETAGLDESVIVFFIPAKQHRLHVPIVETDENGNLNLVTILVGGTKYLHRTTPGKHFYFLSSVRGRSEMLEANVEAGKIYYTYVSQHPESRGEDPQYFNAFQFIPVTNPADASFTEDLKACRWFKNTRTAEDWFERNLPDLQRRAVESRITHRKDSAKKVIAPEYGTTALIQ